MIKKTFKSRVGEFIIPKLPISRQAFDFLRFELNAVLLRASCNLNPIKIRKIKQVTQKDHLSVNIGAGPFGEEEWVNLDMFLANNISFTYDCRRKLPFNDNSVARIRCEHVLEHLDRRDETPYFLKECFRCLEPGGVLRIIVPDAQKFINAYCQNTEQAWANLDIPVSSFNEEWQPMDALNKIYHQGGEHKFGYDFETMKITIQKAGFQQIQRMDYRQSIDPLLINDQANHKAESLYVECLK